MLRCIMATANRMAQKWWNCYTTASHSHYIGSACVMFSKALHTDSTTPKRRHYLLEILHSLLHSLLQILHSGLNLQSMNVLGNHIATGKSIFIRNPNLWCKISRLALRRLATITWSLHVHGVYVKNVENIEAMTTPANHSLHAYSFESKPPHNRKPILYTSVTGE